MSASLSIYRPLHNSNEQLDFEFDTNAPTPQHPQPKRRKYILWALCFTFSVLALVALSLLLVHHPGPSRPFDQYRFCVTQDDPNTSTCQYLEKKGRVTGLNITCVFARDRVECLEKIIRLQADFTLADPEDMYVAAFMPLELFVVFMEIRNREQIHEDQRYESVTVVHNSLDIKDIRDLQGKSVCTTGMGRTAGYKIPVTKLAELGVLGPLDDPELTPRENELRALSRAFSKACVSGKWAPDVETDRRLKSNYSSLCALCENPGGCDVPGKFSGYDGALRCLTQNEGDLAWTKLSAVQEFFGLTEGQSAEADPALFSYLCLSGEKRPLQGGQPCSLGARPWSAYLAHTYGKDMHGLQDQIALAEKSGNSVPRLLGLSDTTTAVARDSVSPDAYVTYGANYMSVIEREVGSPNRIRMCVRGPVEEKKCQALGTVAYSRGVRPRVECEIVDSIASCDRAVANNFSDVVTLDAEDAYTANRQFNLSAVLVENVTSPDGLEASDFAVALVRTSSSFKSLADLRGVRSCHSGYLDLAGWKVPLASLLQKGLLPGQLCPLGRALADFFSAGSCVPGALASQDNPVVLCSKCDGGSCATSANDRNGEEVAFRCLSGGSGDVAFLDALSAIRFSDRKSSSNLTAGDFELLCPDGGTAPLAEFARCNLAEIPTRAVMARRNQTEVRLEEMRMAFLDIADLLTKRKDVLSIFGPFEGKDDLIFKNTAKSLNIVDPKSSVHEKFYALMDVYRSACPD